MKLSKKIISILIISILVIIIGSSAVACLPLTTEEGGTTEGAQAEEPGGFADIFASYGTWVWLAILVVAFYFLLIRPQRMRTKKSQELVSSLQRGDEVVTVGGFHGRIKDIREDVIIVTIASGVDVKINKSSVSRKASQ
ncbi:MAG: preprotein translocase subunit YajC [Actinobacteria bacterium]|nr:MAG: preprotein translocase subunit YajC [Actinomycetota bacterium]